MIKNVQKSIALLLAMTLFLTSCASTTMINSVPSGANVYIDSEPVGTTPYSHTDSKVTGSTTRIKLTKDGYEDFYYPMTKDEEVHVGAVVGGFLIMIPFLWTLKYKPSRTYELIPLDNEIKEEVIEVEKQKEIHTSPKETEFKTEKKKSSITSKADRLRELKALLDEGILTQEEFENEKKKILEEE
ncbi:hypothetical protein CW751_09675 [Brumimicrobium salinarum]|uniref:PEGA domain-containing protein n=1 Tax=Brumimicrobium salinarum TaxID=2058658 RepID=A0A2I0R238_9FLAO|nr:PEGA domain-containing protein [Brumimicrobium salinarum]PKR80629.1 hypothetical protein CW751_09675 [Brumimicrobium salinarum]